MLAEGRGVKEEGVVDGAGSLSDPEGRGVRHLVVGADDEGLEGVPEVEGLNERSWMFAWRSAIT